MSLWNEKYFYVADTKLPPKPNYYLESLKCLQTYIKIIEQERTELIKINMRLRNEQRMILNLLTLLGLKKVENENKR